MTQGGARPGAGIGPLLGPVTQGDVTLEAHVILR
jgi:hypothetical protein